MSIEKIILNALQEDVGDGDHSSLLSIPPNIIGSSQLIVKENGIIAGVEVAEKVFSIVDENLKMEIRIHDGEKIKKGDIVFIVSGKVQSILTAERLVLNIMQRMSGIATKTAYYNSLIAGTGARLLDTRKTTPNFRILEKMAVKIGGGCNHRMGLYDMIMLKDNHIDFAGGLKNALEKTNYYLKEKGLNLKIEIETRSIEEVKEALRLGGFFRIMFDNFTPEKVKEAVALVNKRYETEASGNITEETILAYAKTGVDFISVGALTNKAKSLDLSLKAI
ncbi:MAG TPA: carboxylating nicotinate-nucleotide diphosphorylase [Bacteroidales bacterium]|nr:carboxylating nicotinate-nucleotide diphosphorylase [Bacteroidales bacterium]HON21057.1 carboxylating nicotinate-nucleotide diphosphorylase [Bacteroidales bacterium]HOR81610.1 carboxylating nicotinate-nucleotide diphosphorylase [Bacteroidales bacterium]HPJ90314.1 carboxylating nicotinate-nucleotide diphosphorylase [Bacteroidales bacterium]HPX59470.1 carboxylating nicotinate-nucleotide diphosphorylase [Bacteroidales bacterium]